MQKKRHSKPSIKKRTVDTQSDAVEALIYRCIIPLAKLKKSTDTSILPKTTQEVAVSTSGLRQTKSGFGQARALSAIDTAIDISAKGYNIFAVGENGLGKRTFITDYLQQTQKSQGSLIDWIYVHNFVNPKYPLTIDVPAGSASILVDAIGGLWHSIFPCLKADLQQTDESSNKVDMVRNIVREKVDPVINNLLGTFSSNKKLTDYLEMIRQDMVEHAQIMTDENDARFKTHPLTTLPSRYCINIINRPFGLSNNEINNKQQTIPIIYEDTPSIERLIGCIGQTQHLGTTITDVSMIQSGALHLANGGYLLLKASYLLSHPQSWQALKHALNTQKIQLPSQECAINGCYTALTPEPIPLNVKVILLGDPDTYDAFFEQDAELTSLFKIRADFHDDVSRTPSNELAMVATMADLIDKYQLLHFNAPAQASILEYLSLQAEDQNKLSLHITRLAQLMLESNRHATQASATKVTAKHVKQALDDIDYRSSYLKELYLHELTSGQQLISLSGNAIGQINALTVIDYADSEFGMPARLTAVVQHSEGSGDILDIERDVELGGSLHAKGMLIMNSYLRALFSPYHPLNFTASLAFEQSYAHIDGDSATLAEACALLSALAGIPISQSLAITGSMNQLGMVQAVGGINAKISGFYDTCYHQGLTGSQGVILPVANITQLMLRDDIIMAVKAGKFHVYGVASLSEALTILTGLSIDTVNKKGHYRKSSLFGKVLKNLKRWDEDLNFSDSVVETTDAKTDADPS